MKANHRVVNFLLCFAAFACMPTIAKDSRAEACDRQWLDDSGTFVHRAQPDYAGLLKYWRDAKPRCAGTVTYEARLALIHYYLNDYTEARRVLAGVSDRASPYYHLVEWLSIAINLSEIDHLPDEQKPAALRKGRAQLEDFTRRFPNSAEGFNMLASMLTYLDEWDEALRALDETKRLASPDVSKMGMYRNYSIVYTELGRYNEAVDAGAEALSYTTSLRQDPPFMLALMRAYAALGRIDEAKEVTQTLVNEVPGIHETPEFRSAVAKLRKTLAEANSQKAAAAKP